MNFEMNRILLIKPLFLHDQEVKTKIQISSDFKDQSFFFLTCNIEVLTKFQPTKNIREKWELELMFEKILLRIIITAWKVSKYGVFSGPYFPGFGLNTEIYSVSLRNQSEYWKIRTRKNFVFGHFSRSVWILKLDCGKSNASIGEWC